ncbi:MAG: LysR family transcriptional regulator [Nannocystaceae bacterium]
MELTQLRALIAVIDAGSLLTASRALRISRSTMSARIDELEESLGRPLLVRTHRGIHPTEFGRRFADDARGLLRDADALTSAARRSDQEVAGPLRLRGAVGLPAAMLTTLVAEVARRFPGITVLAEAARDPSEHLTPDVDVVIHFGPRVESGPYRTFALGRFPERLVASRRYLAEHGRPRGLTTLEDHRLMSWRPPGELGDHLPLRDGGALPIAPFFVSDQVDVLLALARADQGIALIPDLRGDLGADDDDLEVLLPELVGREASLWALLPEARAASPRSRALVQILRELAPGVSTPRPDATPSGWPCGGRERREGFDACAAAP